MPIFGQNSILNVFVPKFLLKTPLDGQILVWDSDINGFVNVSMPNQTAAIADLQSQINALKNRVSILEAQIDPDA